MFRIHKQKFANFAKIAAAFVLCVAITGIPAAAQSPEFPERMPIVERPFSEDPRTSSVSLSSAIKPAAAWTNGPCLTVQ